MPSDSPQTSATRVECSASDSFSEWLAAAGGTVAATTYQANKLALVSSVHGQPSLLMRDFDKPLGLAVSEGRMAIACRQEVHVLATSPRLAFDYLETHPGRYDHLYLPRVTFHTGDLNTHDIAFGGDGELWLALTRFSCLANPSDRHSFSPRWRPPFVSQLVPEDRCHLNGFAMQNGQPKYVTALGASDEVGGWRTNKATGGVVIDVESGEIVARGLAMPHSPRIHRGQLYVLNSAEGTLCRVELPSGRLEVICKLPGYLRGLSLVGEHALVGLCQMRETAIFGEVPVQTAYAKLKCGVAIVDLARGREVGIFEFTAGCHEMFDVQYLPGVLRPNVLNLAMPATREAFTAPDTAYWLRKSNEIL